MPVGDRPAMPPGIGRIAVTGFNGSAPWANVFHVELLDPSDLTFQLWESVVQNLGAAFVQAMTPVMHDACRITRAEGQVRLAGGGQFFATRILDGIGVHAGDSLTAQVAACISWKTIGPSWKGGQPRNYIAGIPDQAAADTTSWSGSYLGLLQTAADTFLAQVNALENAQGAVNQLGVLRYVDDDAWLTPPVFHPYVAGSIDPRVDTQRRRLGPT